MSRYLKFFIISAFFVSGIPQSLGQATQAIPSQSTGQHGPLGDYIPCLFDSAAQYDMRARPRPGSSQASQPVKPTTVDYQTAVKLVDSIDKSIDRYGAQNGVSVGVFKHQFDTSLTPTDLTGQTPDAAYTLIDKKLRAANDVIDKKSYFSENEKLNPADLTQAAQSIINGLAVAVVDASAQTVQGTTSLPFRAPDDVSCSISIMPWKETNDVFGKRVADQFVALQVTIRNLNTKNEFLIHDIQVAVDTGVSPEYFGRFQAGRDKLLVRAVAQRGESDDTRNLVLHSLQTIGSVAGAASITAGTVEFKDAIAVFQGAFLQGFANIFPDHTIEQLNHINDLVFSASNTSKVVVPIQGAVPLVTFIAARPIEELPFAWCGYRPKKASSTSNGALSSDPTTSTDGNFVLQGTFGRSTAHCNAKSLPGYGYPYADELQYDSNDPWDDLPFRKWKPAALRMLQDHSYVVIGGVHIQEVITQPKVTAAPVCPTLSNGAIDISETKDGMVTCTMVGSGLSSVSLVSLEKGNTKITGAIKPSIDGNSAILQLKPDVLSDNEGNFSLHLSYKSGAQSEPLDADTGELVTLAKQPILASAGSLDLSKVTSAQPASVTLQGKDLDQLTSLLIVPDDGGASAKTTTFTIQTTSAATASFDLDTLTKAGLDAAKKYHLAYGIKADTSKQVDVKTISASVSGKLVAPVKPKAKPGFPPVVPDKKK